MPAAPPSADTKKPATAPPAKTGPESGKSKGSAGNEKKGAADKGDAKAAAPAQDKEKDKGKAAGAPAAADKATGQQRFDRMAVRAKMAVSEPGDSVEREADAMADKVMRAPAPAGKGDEKKPQTPAAAPSKPAGDKPVQRQAASEGKTPPPEAEGAPPGGASDLLARLGPGQPLDADARSFFEQRMGHDLSDVRIHADENAATAARSLRARAFTCGDHIAFAGGEYQPQSESGKRLLAHELAHVAQQASGTITRAILRKPAAAAPAATGDFEVTHAELEVPPIKSRHLGAYTALSGNSLLRRKGAYDASTRGTKQVGLWTGDVKPELEKIPVARRPSAATGFNLSLDVAGGATSKVIKAGSLEELTRLLQIPTWNSAGGDVQFQVDHMVEYQLGGADAVDNMELLDQAHNGSVGSSFSHGIKRTVREEIQADPGKPTLQSYTGPRNAANEPTAEGVMEAMTVVFKKLKGRARESARKEGGSTFWSKESIKALDHVLPLLGATGGLDGTAVSFALLSPTGNLLIVQLPHGEAQNAIDIGPNQAGGMAGFVMKRLVLSPGYNDLGEGADIGTLTGTLDFGPAVEVPKQDVSVGVSQARGPVGKHSGKVGVATGSGLPNEVNFKPMSPLALSGITFGKGVFGTAALRPGHPALAGLTIPAQIVNGKLGIFHTIDATQIAERLKIPGVAIDSAAVTLGYDGVDFSVSGGVEFTIRNFGTGFLNASLDTQKNFELTGGLRADKRLFDQADMRLWYRSEGGFGGSGTLAITQPGKIKGLKSARVTAKFEDSVFTATGDVVPDIPGLKAASLSVKYENELLDISGTLGVDDKVPGVERAEITVNVKQVESGWKVSASGQVTPKLPACLAGSQLTFAYDDGFVLVEGRFTIDKGPLKGEVTAGVTNAPVDKDGKRADTGSGKTFKVFGAADISAEFIKDKLSGNLKLRLLPDGGVRVGGGLTVNDFEVFPQLPADDTIIDRKVESPPVPLPGFGFAVGSVSVGITFGIGGFVKARASVGPGSLKAITVNVREFDPANLDLNTLEIGGGATFEVPAHAGLEVGGFIYMAFSAAVVQLKGKIGVSASVGIPEEDQPVLRLPTQFTYSMAKGLDISSTLNINLQPSLKFRLFGEVSAELNVVVDTITLWSKDWTLAEANYKLPIGIVANSKLGYNSATGLTIDPKSAISVKTPDLTGEDFKKILDGSPAPADVTTTDAQGVEVDPSELVCMPPADPNASFMDEEPNQSLNPKREAGAATPPAGVDEGVVERLGTGVPLDLATRGFFEQRLKTNLADVRIHTGPGAAREAKKLSARAFTVGRHIAFAVDQYQPDTAEGRELLAHELAHVVQQQGGAARQVMREATSPAAPPPAAGPAPAAVAGATPAAAPAATPAAAARGPITLPQLKLPELKYGTDASNSHRKVAYDAALTAGLERPAGYRRADVDSQQSRIWTRATPAATLQAGLAAKVQGLDPSRIYVAVPRSRTLAGAGERVIVGNPNDLALALRQPRWDREGVPDSHPFEIDHIIELQLGGALYDRESNLELLERQANGASGRAIDASMNEAFTQYAASPAAAALPEADRNAETLRRQYRVQFAGFVPQGAPSTGKRWTLTEVQAGDPAVGLRIYDPANLTGPPPAEPTAILHPWPAGVDAARFTGSANTLVIYATPRGGEPRQVPLRDGQPADPARAIADLLPGIRTDEMTLDLATSGEGPIGRIRGSLTHEQLGPDARLPMDIVIKRRRGLTNAGVLNTENTVQRLTSLLRDGGVTGLSPVVIEEVDIRPGVGLYVAGRVQPDVDLLRGASLDFQIRGNELVVSKTFYGGELTLGGPLRVDGSDLTVAIGTRTGLEVSGGVAFSIQRLGSGTLRGTGRVGAFAVDGRFDFDRRLFDADAHILLAYRRGGDAPNGKLSGSGTVTIGPGKVRGIRRATVQASFDGEERSVSGNAELDIPGVESATLGVQFTPEGGTEITGDARFRDRPGMRNGRIHATLTESADGWRLAAQGSAEATFAGITAALEASYDDGLFLFAADAPFAVGERVSGNVRVGLTNGAVDDEGRLVAGSAPASGGGAELHPFGNGTVTVRLNDWLQGGVGVKVRTNGDLLVSGVIGISRPITVFDQYPPPERATRTLFSMPTVSVPLVGLSVGGTVVGVALTVGGRVTGHAHVGPGRLTQTELRVEDFNPAQPDSLHVTGDARFELPAEAGVAASLDAGVSLGAAVIRATAGVNVTAGVSLAALATPHVHMDWRPSGGLTLHADLDASLSPRLAFDVNGFAEVVADAFVTTFTLWRKQWNLAHREIGSSLAMRLHAPVDFYDDGRGVVFDPARVTFDVPSLNADTLRQLLNEEGGQEQVERAPPAAATSGGTNRPR